MVRYIDTSSGDPDDGLGAWLAANLVLGSEAFLIQSAWFSYGSLEPFASSIADLVSRDAEVQFVIGANQGSLTKVDLERLWTLISPGSGSRLVVVRYRNAIFHPKVFYLEREDGTKSAVVGSANLTTGGTQWNVEAGIILDTSEGDGEEALNSIRATISGWFDLDEDGVFEVKDSETIQTLADDGIIDVAQSKKIIEPWGSYLGGVCSRRRGDFGDETDRHVKPPRFLMCTAKQSLTGVDVESPGNLMECPALMHGPFDVSIL